MYKEYFKKLRIITLILVVFFVISNNFFILFADDIDEDEFSINDLEDIVETSAKTSEKLVLNSRIAVAFDRKSGRTVWGKEENKKTAMASTTKMLTAVIAIENGNLNDVVEVSAKAASTGGSRLGLKKGDKVSLHDLLYGLMLRSGNDAAIAIAEHIGGNVENFANLMNKKATELGLKNSHFVTPHGLDDPEHYTTAVELAKIADYGLKNETFAEIVGSKNYTITINGYAKSLNNTNELLGYLDGVYGVKTGFTNNAGRCLVTSVVRGNMDIIFIVLQADSKKNRTLDSINLINYVFDNYEQVDIGKIVDKKFNDWCNINKNRIVVNKSKNPNINLNVTPLKNEFIVVKKSDIDNIDIKINGIFQYEAPISKNKTFGDLKVTVGGECVDCLDINFEYEIEKMTVMDYFIECIEKLKI